MLYFYRSSNGKLADLVSPGQTVLDIGANIGEVSLSFAKKVGEAGRVIAFEPNPPIFNQLKKNCELNPDLRVLPENLALGDADGVVEMIQPDGRNPGTVTVNPGESGKKNCAANIPVTTLDAYLQKKSIGKVDLIKIDVEGYEGHVLDGAANTIQKNHPVIIMELVDAHQQRHGGSARLIADKLKKHGYTLRELNTRQILPDEYSYEGCSLDVLCEPD
jgi:FkbM family methyltransferase